MHVGSLLGPPSANPSAVTEIQLQGPDPPGNLAHSLLLPQSRDSLRAGYQPTPPHVRASRTVADICSTLTFLKAGAGLVQLLE